MNYVVEVLTLLKYILSVLPILIWLFISAYIEISIVNDIVVFSSTLKGVFIDMKIEYPFYTWYMHYHIP